MNKVTRPQRKAAVPQESPTRSQLGWTVSGLEAVNKDLLPTAPTKHTFD